MASQMNNISRGSGRGLLLLALLFAVVAGVVILLGEVDYRHMLDRAR